jgi:hypothetical protein
MNRRVCTRGPLEGVRHVLRPLQAVATADGRSRHKAPVADRDRERREWTGKRALPSDTYRRGLRPKPPSPDEDEARCRPRPDPPSRAGLVASPRSSQTASGRSRKPRQRSGLLGKDSATVARTPQLAES